MSHFSVLVIGKDPESALRPYQENNMGDAPGEFLKFNDSEDEYRKQYAEELVTAIREADGKLYSWYDERYKDGFGGKNFPKDSAKVDVKVSEIYPTFEIYMAQYVGFKERDPKTNRYGYWENPNAKWDWWEIGGRWAGFFKLKPDTIGKVGKQYGKGKLQPTISDADVCLKKNVDFTAMRDEASKEAAARYDKVVALFGGEVPKLKPWKDYLEDKTSSVDERRDRYHAQTAIVRLNQLRTSDTLSDTDKEFLGWGFSFDDFQCTREEYCKRAANAAAVPFAVLHEGVWYERGSMGWWGAVSDEEDIADWSQKVADLYDTLPDDTQLTLVDCHI